MSGSYQVHVTKRFSKQYHKYKKQNVFISKKIIKVVEVLLFDPFKSSLKTHKVHSRNLDSAYSSRVTGDIRIIWDYKEGKAVILLLEVGGHNDVY